MKEGNTLTDFHAASGFAADLALVDAFSGGSYPISTTNNGTWPAQLIVLKVAPGPNANVTVFVTVGAPGTLPRSGGMDSTVAGLLGVGLLATGWFLRTMRPRQI